MLNAKWAEDKKSLTKDEKFRRNALKRTILSRGRRIGLKCDEEIGNELLKSLYENMQARLNELNTGRSFKSEKQYL